MLMAVQAEVTHQRTELRVAASRTRPTALTPALLETRRASTNTGIDLEVVETRPFDAHYKQWQSRPMSYGWEENRFEALAGPAAQPAVQQGDLTFRSAFGNVTGVLLVGTSAAVFGAKGGPPAVVNLSRVPNVETALRVDDHLLVVSAKNGSRWPGATSARTASGSARAGGSSGPATTTTSADPLVELYGFDATTGQGLWHSGGDTTPAYVGDLALTSRSDEVQLVDLRSGVVVKSLRLPHPVQRVHTSEGFLYAGDSQRSTKLRLKRDAAKVTKESASEPWLGPPAQCGVSELLLSVGARDLARLRAAQAPLREAMRETPFLKTLADTATDLERWSGRDGATSNGTVDLYHVAPTALPAPPWQRTPPRAPMPTSSARVQFTQVSKRRSESWDNPDMLHAPNEFHLAPVDQGVAAPAQALGLPAYYGVRSLRWVRGDANDLLALYGARYLTRVQRGKAVWVFDVEAYAKPPTTKVRHVAFADFPLTGVSSAMVRGDVLYVCDADGSYAAEADGKKGFITALSLPTGAVLWRSAPVVCGGAVTTWRDYLVTGYGFTDEPDFLYALRLSDGEVVGRFPVADAPSVIVVQDDMLEVQTYSQRYRVRISETKR
jgi:outer membrane protein assembly factor BamB